MATAKTALLSDGSFKLVVKVNAAAAAATKNRPYNAMQCNVTLLIFSWHLKVQYSIMGFLGITTFLRAALEATTISTANERQFGNRRLRPVQEAKAQERKKVIS